MSTYRKIWNESTIITKILISIIIFLLIRTVYIEYKLWIVNRQRIKDKKELIQENKDSLRISEQKTIKYQLKARQEVKSLELKSKEIDTKMREDEKNIDNSTITDEQRKNFISKYEGQR